MIVTSCLLCVDQRSAEWPNSSGWEESLSFSFVCFSWIRWRQKRVRVHPDRECACIRSGGSSYLAGALLMLCCLELRVDPTCSWETRDLKREREILSSLDSLTYTLHFCVCVCVYLWEYRGYGRVERQLTVGQTLDEPVSGGWVKDGPWLAADRGTLTLRLHRPTAVLPPGCRNTHTHRAIYILIIELELKRLVD